MATDIKKLPANELIELLQDNKNSKAEKTEKQEYEQVFEFMKGSNTADFTDKLGDFSNSNIEMLSLNNAQNAQKANNNAKVEQYSVKGNEINKRIDPSCQGQAGDCWLLSTLNSLSYSAEGQNIIKDAIKDNGNGSHSVNLKGLKTKITVTDEELAEARKTNKYSSGDDDILLMEIAFEKAMDKVKNGEIKADNYLKRAASDGDRSIDWGCAYDAIYILTGEKSNYYSNKDHWSNNGVAGKISKAIRSGINKITGSNNTVLESVYDKLEKNSGGYCATISFQGNEQGSNPVTVKDVDGNDVILSTGNGGHIWSIKSVQGDNVTIVNPWDSSKEITVSKKEIAKYVTGIETYKYN